MQKEVPNTFPKRRSTLKRKPKYTSNQLNRVPILIGFPLSPLSLDKQEILSDISFFKTIHKNNFEIVITRFDETLDWTEGIEHLCTVYNKGEPFSYKGTVINVPNYGLDLEVILRHIITNYNSLSRITFFAQGLIADRTDQPLFPIKEYYTQCSPISIFANTTIASDPPTWQYEPSKYLNEYFQSVNKDTLSSFRKNIVHIPYQYLKEKWVRGLWMSVGKYCIRTKSLEYYKKLYEACKFNRATRIEEIWFLERSIYSIFILPILYPIGDDLSTM
jgi:hypothetical protein